MKIEVYYPTSATGISEVERYYIHEDDFSSQAQMSQAIYDFFGFRHWKEVVNDDAD